MAECDGLVVGSPVHYASPAGSLIAFLDRLFYSGGGFAHKPAAAVVSARRGGTSAALDVLNKYFTISQMPVVSSTYWNMVHGSRPGTFCRMQRVCRPCATWAATWRGSSAVLKPGAMPERFGPRRNGAAGPISSGERCAWVAEESDAARFPASMPLYRVSHHLRVPCADAESSRRASGEFPRLSLSGL